MPTRLDAGFAGLIDTARGPVHVSVTGRGPRTIVVHGGPGLDHTALLSGLAPLAERRTLICFDQLGCGRTPPGEAPLTATATFDHARAAMEAIGDEPEALIAHSWGALVAAATGRQFAETLLIAPMPLDAPSYDGARAVFRSRITPELWAEVGHRLGQGEDGAPVFALMVPLYVGNPAKTLPPIPITAATYFAVDATIADFDFNRGIVGFGSLSLVRGDRDFVESRFLQPLIKAAISDRILGGVGHFPFFEDPTRFAAATC